MRHGWRLVWAAALAGSLAGGCDFRHENPFARAPDLSARAVETAAGDYPVCPPEADAAEAPAGKTLTWLELGRYMAVTIGADEPAEAHEPAGLAYVHWKDRRGPAYPGDLWRSFGRDVKELVPTMWDDTKATFTDPWALVGLGLAGASGIAICASDADDRVADHYTKHGSQLSKCGDMIGDVGGNPGLHFAFAGAMYFTSLARDDVRNYEVSKALINALAINGLTTIALKGITQTNSPNGDPFGWPSGHTSSTFCLATVMHEAYGPWVGVPLFAFASFVGYERIDARNHDFSDVISGAFIGIAIGHAVMKNHKTRIAGMELVPLADPGTGTVGMALAKKF